MGEGIYVGRPCKQCGNRERYFSNATCVACNLERNRQWRRAHPDRASRHRRNAALKAKYGVTLDWYESTLAFQEGTCACCPAAQRLRPFGEVALLCPKCLTAAKQLKEAPALYLLFRFLDTLKTENSLHSALD